MEYLLPRVGQDQETIMKSLESLMKKVEKFDEMEANFKEVLDELDSLKDQNYQNKKVVRDLRNELAFKKDIID